MDSLSGLFAWIGENEAVLSGIAAVIAIAAVVFALSTQTFGLFRRKSLTGSVNNSGLRQSKIPQEIRYCRLDSGLKIAWATAGSGLPLVRSLGWFTNLEAEWDSDVASPFWQALASRYQLIRYDGRGMGLSDRNVEDFNPDTRLEDLEAVVDASGVEKFALMGLSEGGSTAIRYAHKYPERVSHIILWGSFLNAPRFEDIPQFVAIAKLIPKLWGTDSPAFHQAFTAVFLPDGDANQNRFFNDMQRNSATPDAASRFLAGIGEIDVRDVARKVEVPTLVLHRKGDMAIPVQYGKDCAAELQNARLILLDGNNHWMVSDQEDLDKIIGLIEDFTSDGNS